MKGYGCANEVRVRAGFWYEVDFHVGPRIYSIFCHQGGYCWNLDAKGRSEEESRHECLGIRVLDARAFGSL